VILWGDYFFVFFLVMVGCGLCLFICDMVWLIDGLIMLSSGFGKNLSIMISNSSGVSVEILCRLRFFILMMFLWMGLVMVCWYIYRM